MAEGRIETGALVTGGLAGILASVCCVGPLILVSVGIGGAWVGTLTVFYPYPFGYFWASRRSRCFLRGAGFTARPGNASPGRYAPCLGYVAHTKSRSGWSLRSW